ncbi:MAG: hypothetical protein N4A47_03205 [Clostridia bacterium]|jgi:hypothetical protein|nr:hypothetical protein [Clostridia bacterium]
MKNMEMRDGFKYYFNNKVIQQGCTWQEFKRLSKNFIISSICFPDIDTRIRKDVINALEMLVKHYDFEEDMVSKYMAYYPKIYVNNGLSIYGLFNDEHIIVNRRKLIKSGLDNYNRILLSELTRILINRKDEDDKNSGLYYGITNYITQDIMEKEYGVINHKDPYSHIFGLFDKNKLKKVLVETFNSDDEELSEGIFGDIIESFRNENSYNKFLDRLNALKEDESASKLRDVLDLVTEEFEHKLLSALKTIHTLNAENEETIKHTKRNVENHFAKTNELYVDGNLFDDTLYSSEDAKSSILKKAEGVVNKNNINKCIDNCEVVKSFDYDKETMKAKIKLEGLTGAYSYYQKEFKLADGRVNSYEYYIDEEGNFMPKNFESYALLNDTDAFDELVKDKEVLVKYVDIESKGLNRDMEVKLSKMDKESLTVNVGEYEIDEREAIVSAGKEMENNKEIEV